MQGETNVPDTFTLTGDYEHRVLEALKVAQHQVRLAQPMLPHACWKRWRVSRTP